MIAVQVDVNTRVFGNLKHPNPASTHLYLIRHGQTAGNAGNQLIGHTDMPLDDRGMLQAGQIAMRMRAITLDTIISSPLQRARATATEIASHHRLKIEIDPRLIEMNFGHCEGLTVAEAIARY